MVLRVMILYRCGCTQVVVHFSVMTTYYSFLYLISIFRNENGDTALHLAASNGRAEIAHILMNTIGVEKVRLC